MIKLSIDLIDYAGKYLVLSSIPGKGHAKILTAGIGWAGAEVILTRFLDLWVGARGAEFDWKYIQNSLDSNICLVSFVHGSKKKKKKIAGKKTANNGLITSTAVLLQKQ